VVTLTSMRALEQHLPAGQFMRIHRSYIVNVSRIIIIDRQKVTLIGNHSLPVSDGYRQKRVGLYRSPLSRIKKFFL